MKYVFRVVSTSSTIRCETTDLLRIDTMQEVLSPYWKPYMNNLQIHMTDATCYESHIRYPTTIKLLWEAISWLYPYLCIYKSLGLRTPSRCKAGRSLLQWKANFIAGETTLLE